MRAIPCHVRRGAWLHPAAREHSGGCRSSAERQREAAAHTAQADEANAARNAFQKWCLCHRGALKQHEVAGGQRAGARAACPILLVPAVLLLGLPAAPVAFLCFGKLHGQELCSAFPYSSVSYHHCDVVHSLAGTVWVLGTCAASWRVPLLQSYRCSTEVQNPIDLVVFIILYFLAPN